MSNQERLTNEQTELVNEITKYACAITGMIDEMSSREPSQHEFDSARGVKSAISSAVIHARNFIIAVRPAPPRAPELVPLVQAAFAAAAAPHMDNTGSICNRPELESEHDCCVICNARGAMRDLLDASGDMGGSIVFVDGAVIPPAQ